MIDRWNLMCEGWVDPDEIKMYQFYGKCYGQIQFYWFCFLIIAICNFMGIGNPLPYTVYGNR